MNKWKHGIALSSMLVILSGCGLNLFTSGKEIPESVETDVTAENYEDFVSMYEGYEENMREHDGTLIKENGDMKDLENGTFGDEAEVLQRTAEERYDEENENGEVSLNETEEELLSDLISLTMIQSIEEFTEDVQQNFWDNNPELEAYNIEEALIFREQKIIDTLDLGKEPITSALIEERRAAAAKEAEEERKQTEEQARQEQEAMEEQQEEAELKSNADIEGEVSSNGTSSNQDINYDPDYMGQDEWETCTGTEAYTIQECIGWDQSYAYGEGREELMAGDDPDNYVMGTLDRAREGWDNDDGNYEQAYEAGKEVVKDFYEDRNEIDELTFSAFETLRVEDIMRDDKGNIIINTVVGIKKGLEEEPEFVPYRVEMTEELEYRYLYMPDDHYYEELDGEY